MNEAQAFGKAQCLSATTTDPVVLLVTLMQDERIPMHGPIHHFLDGLVS